MSDDGVKPESGKSGTDNEFAWRLHDGLGDWTARVDTKASIALAIEAATAGFVATLATGDGALANASGWPHGLLIAGVILLAASVIGSVAVVFPQLRGLKTKAESKVDFVYFGHLRHWESGELTKQLASNPMGLSQLSRQIVNMSKIAWRKHRWLQWSLGLFLASVLLIGIALMVPAGQPASVPSVPTTPVPVQPSETPSPGATP